MTVRELVRSVRTLGRRVVGPALDASDEMILDSARNLICGGDRWIERFEARFREAAPHLRVERRPCDEWIRFGQGKKVHADTIAVLPVGLYGRSALIYMVVVPDSDLGLLCSKQGL